MRIVSGLIVAALAAVPALAQQDAISRLAAATQDLPEMLDASDKGIPQDLIAKASCIVIVPTSNPAASWLARSTAKTSLHAVGLAARAGLLLVPYGYLAVSSVS